MAGYRQRLGERRTFETNLEPDRDDNHRYRDYRHIAKVGGTAWLEGYGESAEASHASHREAYGEQVAVMARPARITKARKTLGKVRRN